MTFMFLFLFPIIAGLGFYLFQLLAWNQEQRLSTRFFQQSFKASINQYEYLPALLANDHQFKTTLQNSSKQNRNLSKKLKFIADRSGANTAYIMNRAGTVIASSNYDQENSFLNHNYSFRPYFSKAIALKKRQFYYAIGATTGIPGFFISEPILGEQDKVLGVAVVKLDLSEWEKNWQEAGQDILIADENSVTILSGQKSWRYHSIDILSTAILEDIQTQQQFGNKDIPILYGHSSQYYGPGGISLSFWEIDKEIFRVNSYPINDTGWTLYYLENNSDFIQSAIAFALIVFIGLTLSYLYFRERRSKLHSRRQARNNEIRHRRELETIIENIHIGVLSIDRKGHILFLNDAARQMLQIDMKYLSDHPVKIQQMVEIKNINTFEKQLDEGGDIVKPFYETTLVKQGEFTTPVMFAISQVSMEGDDRLLVTLVNIEKRKNAEEALVKINESLEDQVERRTQALKDAQEELVRQSKIAALGKMAATIVHELSQPLSAMNSSIAATQFKVEKDDWQGALQSISRLSPLGDKMNNVIKLLKFFSYPDDQKLQHQELAPLIQQSVALYQDRLKEKKISINIESLEPSVYVRVNPLKLDLVLVNIIQNAIDAMKSSDHHAEIRISLEIREGNALIIIADQGDGINSRVMGQLFDPYFTTKEIGKGLGLGLSICHEIIQEYQGNIIAENTDEGAHFLITLPTE